MSEHSPTQAADQHLIQCALRARAASYAPYSNYQVGCALLADGVQFTGANVENASYGLTICAERTTVSQAVLAGHRELQTVVVATQSSPPAPPCGMCLQTFGEFTTNPSAVRIILVNPDGEQREFTLKQLLPHGFNKDQLSTSGEHTHD